LIDHVEVKGTVKYESGRKGHLGRKLVNVEDEVFSENSFVRVFSKPEAHKGRRLAVALVFDKVEAALEKSRKLIEKIKDA
jgi:formate-dependent phosphoribosylglycinamide formyltransferase (GAR transformylase)